jgi:hypothetical protein
MRLSDVSDGVLWLALPVALLTTVYLASQLPEHIKQAAASPANEETSPSQLDDDAEAKIPLEALQVLADGYSYDLGQAAFRVTLNQSLKDSPKTALLKDLSGSSRERREQAVLALYFLVHGPDKNDPSARVARRRMQAEFQNPPAYEAIVTALVNMLPDHRTEQRGPQDAEYTDPPSPVHPLGRPPGETTLLATLVELVHSSKDDPEGCPEGGLKALLIAGLVYRWIASYPFPCTLEAFRSFNHKRREVADLFDTDAYAADDPLMAALFYDLVRHPLGRHQLHVAGLAHRESRIKERFNLRTNDPCDDPALWDSANYTDVGWQTVFPEGGAGTGRHGMDLRRHRMLSSTHQQAALRRRHREAMVLADPDRPARNEGLLPDWDESSLGPRPQPRSGPRRNLATELAARSTPPRFRSGDNRVEPRRTPVRFGYDDEGMNGESSGENSPGEIASRMSYSEIGAGSTPSSLPSLESVDGDRAAEHERARREELESRLGARLVMSEESGVGQTTATTTEDLVGRVLDRAMQAREHARAQEARPRSDEGSD